MFEAKVNLFRPDQLPKFMELLDVLYFDQDARFRFEYDLYDVNEYRENYLRLREYNVFVAEITYGSKGIRPEDDEVHTKLAGFMIGEHISNRVYEVKMLYVDPKWRRRGIAKMLKQALTDHAAGNGYEFIQSKVRANNLESISLNRAFGWKEERDKLRGEWYYWFYKGLK